ncbi:MAG: RagB/SusD family nutrient uptake outer membrane protein, partial [Mucilaginibacter polytrichastri]|nr:RagB/SusD family nutrient uptake outer membrane protein [Mucilaginibacter polytrichastri]
MKKYHKISLITAIALFATGFSGCKKLLEVDPQSAITEQVYFKSEGDFEPYLNGIYTIMRALSNNVTYGTERGEELTSASNSRFTVAWTQIITPTSGAVNYNQWYQGIGNCNLLIDKANSFSFSNEDLRKKILGEAYTLRAFFYFHLTRIIGDVPLMLQPVVDENVPLLSRAPAADVLKQIQTDLAEAIRNFQSQSGFSKTAYPSKYRFCYGSAMCLRADAYLWSAKVLNGGANDLNAAISAATEAEATGLVLNTNFANVTATRAATNTEVAMAAYYQRDEAGNNYGINALAALQFIQGATNLDQIPYTAQVANGQGAYQISAESRA